MLHIIGLKRAIAIFIFWGFLKERSLLDRIELKLGILSKVRLFAAENPSDFLPDIALLSIY
ncbi:hypothetical protein [Nostoc sp.]|uniref:hypothetical protein n=1 Tax=Nostoc sp. TaxID=1180 RepID=UPI002FFC5CC5